jgi:acyl-CoA thioesterase-1
MQQIRQMAFYFASGWGFFVGAAVLVLGGALCAAVPRNRPRALGGARLARLAGCLLVAASATPLPAWSWVAWWTAVALGVVTSASGRRPLRVAGAGALCAATALLVGLEAPAQLRPSAPAARHNTLYLLGDSVLAGLHREGEVTAAQLLRRELPAVDVVDLSHAGATTASALRRAALITRPNATVFVEVGGNDFLRRAPLDEVERNLDGLLEHACREGRAVFMLELPMFPFRTGVARIQRRLARRHGVGLVPRRLFSAILGAPECTVDGLHPTNTGHRRMAELILRTVRPTLAAGAPHP